MPPVRSLLGNSDSGLEMHHVLAITGRKRPALPPAKVSSASALYRARYGNSRRNRTGSPRPTTGALATARASAVQSQISRGARAGLDSVRVAFLAHLLRSFWPRVRRAHHGFLVASAGAVSCHRPGHRWRGAILRGEPAGRCHHRAGACKGNRPNAYGWAKPANSSIRSSAGCRNGLPTRSFPRLRGVFQGCAVLVAAFRIA
jgi:hypothetical protein